MLKELIHKRSNVRVCGRPLMSFNSDARKVRNSDLPLNKRAAGLRSCLRCYCNLAQETSFSALLEHLGMVVGCNLARNAEEIHLLAALSRLENARNQVMELRGAFDRKRIRQKLRGQRVPPKVEQEALWQAIHDITCKMEILPARGTIVEENAPCR